MMSLSRHPPAAEPQTMAEERPSVNTSAVGLGVDKCKSPCMCLSKDPGEIMPRLPTKVINLRIHLGAAQRKTPELCKVSSLEYSVEF